MERHDRTIEKQFARTLGDDCGRSGRLSHGICHSDFRSLEVSGKNQRNAMRRYAHKKEEPAAGLF
jgi:hypothetical protein